MNASVFIVLIAEILNVITLTETSSWWWKGKAKRNHWKWHSSDTESCFVGKCVESWKCHKSSITNHSSDYCGYWNDGPMVCCLFNNSNDLQNATDTYSLEILSNSSEHSKRPIPKTVHSFKFTVENQPGTHSPEEHWNRNSWARPTPLSSLGDILKKSREIYPSPRPHNKVTDIHIDAWKKTTGSTRKYIRTTVSWDKPRTSESRIFFPTESPWIPKVSQHPASVTSYSKSTKSWATRSTISNAPWGYSTTSTRAPNSKSTKSWPTRSTTMKTPWGFLTRSTKGTAFNPALTTKFFSKITNSLATKSINLTSTPTPWRFTTRSTRRTISTTTHLPISRKSTTFARITTPVVFKPSNSDERNNQGSRRSTSVSPSRGQPMNPKSTIRPIFARSSTSKKYRTTTALPDVNTFLCGIRDARSGSSRQKRDYSTTQNASDTLSLGGRLPYQRIVGGEEVEPFTWPWVAALYQVTSSGGYRFLSAGSLINENFVLTAAHVFTAEDLRSSSYVIMLGTHNAQDAVAEYHVSSVLQHPSYEQRYFYHDIALLRLKIPVTFNNYVMPVCLPSPDAPFLRDEDLEGKNVTVMGWGDDSFGGKSSRVLKGASFPVASKSFCNASYVRVASNSFPKGITDDMLCAGDPNGGKDACQGDSGGPLTNIENGRYTQVGIVSFGFQCGDKEYPGVYTKIAPYLSWIAESISCMSNEDYGSDYY